MATIQIQPEGIPPRPYAEYARQEGVARDTLRAVGIEFEGIGPDGQRESYSEAAARLAPHIQAASIGHIATLESTGIQLPDLERPRPVFTPLRTLFARRVVASATKLQTKVN